MSAAGVTRLAIAGCTEAEIATITGLHRDPTLAENAIRKLERRTKTPN